MTLCGWTGRVLRVNLSRKEVYKRQLEKDLALNFLGGRGLCNKILYDEVEPTTHPYSPDNRVIFGAGPVSGTIVPSSGRWTVSAKSPETGLVGDGSGGGFLGAELKWAGYDAVVIQGRSRRPAYLWIDDGSAEIMDATHLWGLDTWEAGRIVRKEIGDPDIQVACIGPAGENLVRNANVIHNRAHAAGRHGAGAVMGSKKLKMMAVRGSKSVRVAHPQRLEKEVEEAVHAIKDKWWAQMVRDGTPGHITDRQRYGVLATRNFQTGVFEEAEKLSGDVYVERYQVKARACFACPLPCKHSFAMPTGAFEGVYGESLQLTTLGSLGALCGNGDFPSLLAIHSLSNKLGVDTLSLGATIAFAMECYQRRLITKADTDGLELTWGNYEAMLSLIPKIAKREGFGNTLAEGSLRASRIIGKNSEKYAMQVKGSEITINEPRGSKGYALGYAVASRGSDHMRAVPGVEYGRWPIETVIEIYGTEKVADRFGVEGKGHLVKWNEDIFAIKDSLEICKHVGQMKLGLLPDFMLKMLHCVTGIEVSHRQFLQIGERIVNLERAFAVREGVRRRDDTLPDRMLKEPMPEGPSKGNVVELEPMLDEYYKERGWDIETGVPTETKLDELGLGYTYDDLRLAKKVFKVPD